MSDDELIAALRRRAHEHDREPYADPSPPPSPTEIERLADHAMRAFAEAEAPEAAPPNVHPLRARRRLWPWIVPLAAGVVFFALTVPRTKRELPSYALELRGGFADQRAAAPSSNRARQRFTSSSPVEIVLRPREPTDASINVDAWVRRDLDWRSFAPAFEQSRDGSILIRGAASELAGEDFGAYELLFWVRPDSDPQPALNIVLSSDRALRATVEIHSRDED